VPKSSREINGLHGLKSRPSLPIKAPVTLLGVGWRWPGARILDRDLLRKIYRAEIGGAS